MVNGSSPKGFGGGERKLLATLLGSERSVVISIFKQVVIVFNHHLSEIHLQQSGTVTFGRRTPTSAPLEALGRAVLLFVEAGHIHPGKSLRDFLRAV